MSDEDGANGEAIKEKNKLIESLRIYWWIWLLLAFVGFALLGTYLNYIYRVPGFLNWSGFYDKTLWDILDLFIIPLTLAGVGYYFTSTQRKADRDIEQDRQREQTLQAYIDRMETLLLDKGLRDSEENDEVRTVARTRTLTVLRTLAPDRRATVVRFLIEARLLSPVFSGKKQLKTLVINMTGANLSGADLYRADLVGVCLNNADLRKTNLHRAWLIKAHLANVDLRWANLSKSVLGGASLTEADLSGANLTEADLQVANLNHANLVNTDLSEADLTGANLWNANLTKAIVTDAQLARATLLKGVTMPDGSRYDGRFNLEGDIRFAQQKGIDTEDAEAMARWYAGSSG